MRFLKGISSTTTDQELISKYKNTSDLDYIGELYNRYLHLIFSVALKYLGVREDAEDMGVKIFEVLKEKLPTGEVSNIGGWVHTVTKNQCLMLLRSKTRTEEKEKDYAFDMEIVEDEHQLSEVDLDSDLRKLEDCIKTLSKEQVKCVNLFYKQEKCYNEVANLTGYTIKNVKSYLQNGKRNLKICMGK
jgi:RNA polymerase sigma factor (sigma-70 family)